MNEDLFTDMFQKLDSIDKNGQLLIQKLTEWQTAYYYLHGRYTQLEKNYNEVLEKYNELVNKEKEL